MRKLLLLIIFTINITLSVQAVEFDNETKTKLNQMGVYFGDPSENKIIGQGDMYLVLHNPTELAIDVMNQEARRYCKQTLGNNYTTNFMKVLGRYTAYFSCEMQDSYDQYDLSVQEKKCIEQMIFESKNCLDLYKKNADVINAILLQKRNEDEYKTNDFVYLVRSKFYKEIEGLEQAAEKNSYQLIIEKNIEICNKYTFQEGSQMFGECILRLIENEKK